MPTRATVQRQQPAGVELLAMPPTLAGLARAQSGVLTRKQLYAGGYTPSAVQAALDGRRWQAFARNVLVAHNGPLTRSQREWVAVLLPDKPAALAGLSAARQAGLAGFEPDLVHVVVAHDTHVRAPRWVRLHESRRFGRGDIRPGGGPPSTAPTRSVIDAATWSTAPRRACAILCAAVQQRVVTVDGLEAELRRAGRIRHVRIMREILGDIGGGGHTLAEIELGPLAAQAGLDRPRRQRTRREPDGAVRYLDAEFDLPDGTVLAVEIDGAGHLRPETWYDDADRENEVVIGGSPVLRFPSLTVRLNPPRVVDQLRRMRLAHSR